MVIILNGQHLFYLLHIGFINQCRLGKVSLALGRLFGKDMAFKSVLPFNFSRGGKGKPFFRAGFCFHLWHN